MPDDVNGKMKSSFLSRYYQQRYEFFTLSVLLTTAQKDGAVRFHLHPSGPVLIFIRIHNI